MKVYLAGPMTGIPQFNFPAFDAYAAQFRRDFPDMVIVSPAELDDPASRAAAMASPDGAPGSGSSNGETWGDFLARDVKLIADDPDLDAIIVLPGWDTSRGARLETFVAALRGLPILDLDQRAISATELLSAWGRGLVRAQKDWIGPDGHDPWSL